MRTATVVRIAAALTATALLALPTVASAQQKKISYEEAFKRCKAFLDTEKGGLANSTTNEATRKARGAACMQKFGHRL